MIMKNTRAIADKIINDVKHFSELYLIASELIYVAFLIYLVVSNAGVLALNVALLCISIIFEAFLIFAFVKRDFLTREHTKVVKHTYRISSLALRAASLGITVYGLGITLTGADARHLLFTVFMLFSWALGVLIELLRFIIERYTSLITTAISKDVEPLVKVKSFFTLKRYEGREETKNDAFVDEIAEDYENKIKSKKEAKKAANEAAKIIRREKRREELQEKTSAVKKKIKSIFKKNGEE